MLAYAGNRKGGIKDTHLATKAAYIFSNLFKGISVDEYAEERKGKKRLNAKSPSVIVISNQFGIYKSYL